MERKQDLEESETTRPHFHALRRLSKAAQWARQLRDLCRQVADECVRASAPALGLLPDERPRDHTHPSAAAPASRPRPTARGWTQMCSSNASIGLLPTKSSKPCAPSRPAYPAPEAPCMCPHSQRALLVPPGGDCVHPPVRSWYHGAAGALRRAHQGDRALAAVLQVQHGPRGREQLHR